ncbi:MAG TPA: LLM class flavin-dependent oxidoreductase [Candidatus Limnocylindria bacterium]|nr:LLM class flavin-dependent oxidoreductase [Candidatus Limnocylindria bacterium]
MRIGITLPVAQDESYRAPAYGDIRQLALTAEQSGLDSIWAADHLLYRPTDDPPRGFWESWTLLTALAEATERIEIGNLTLCMPFRNPGLLAYMAATFEEVSGGRLVLGLGSGWHEPEFRAFGFEFDRRVSYFEDSLEILVPLLREGRVKYAGDLLHAEGPLSPRGPREGGPPILIASKGPRMQRLAARYADRWNTAWYALPREPFWERREGLWAACRDVGRDPAEIEITVGLDVNDASAIDDENREGVLPAEASALEDAFAAWQELGVTEVMCRLEPATPEMAERVARAAEAVRTKPAVA